MGVLPTEIVRAERVDEIARGGWEREERRAKNRSKEKVYTPARRKMKKTKREEEHRRAQDPCTPGRSVSGLVPRACGTSHHAVILLAGAWGLCAGVE